MFTFLAALVEAGVFEEVIVNSPPFGHTHEDIDQVFSVLSRELNRVSARTIPELVKSFERAYSGITVRTLDAVVNVWHTIGPRCIYYELTKSFSFEIRKNGQGQVVFRNAS